MGVSVETAELFSALRRVKILSYCALLLQRNFAIKCGLF